MSGRKLYVCADISIDEALAEIADDDPVTALLWPWLLVHLDDWGRSSASPRRLKAAVAPMMNSVTMDTITKALHAFADHHLIALYEVDGQSYLAVNPEKWWRYQTHIHKSKRDNDQSAIPAPPSDAFTVHRGVPRNLAEFRDGSQVDCASLPPSTYHPTPTTLLPPPSSHTSTHIDTSANAEVVDASPPPDGIDWDGTAPNEEQTTPPADSRISYKRIVEMWNTTCPSLPAVMEIKGERQRRTKQLFELVDGYGGLETFFKRVEASDFLAGRNPSKTHPNWRANYDFITKRATVVQILEGTHDNRGASVPAMNTNTQRALEIFRELKEGEDAGK